MRSFAWCLLPLVTFACWACGDAYTVADGGADDANDASSALDGAAAPEPDAGVANADATGPDGSPPGLDGAVVPLADGGTFCSSSAAAAAAGETRVLCTDFDGTASLAPWSANKVNLDQTKWKSPPRSAAAATIAGGTATLTESFVMAGAYKDCRFMMSIMMDASPGTGNAFSFLELQTGGGGKITLAASGTTFMATANAAAPTTFSLGPGWNDLVIDVSGGLVKLYVNDAVPLVVNGGMPFSFSNLTVIAGIFSTQNAALSTGVHLDNIAVFLK